MKKIFLISSIVTILMSCGSSGNGELIGVQQREFWNPTDPYGMVFIPQGSFVMGPSDQDVPFANVTSAKTVSVGAFYLDETGITNNEYRQFTNWVRDSMVKENLIQESLFISIRSLIYKKLRLKRIERVMQLERETEVNFCLK